MKYINREAFFQLYEVRKFVDGIVEVLAGGRSLILLIPAWIDAEEVWSKIWSTLWARDCVYEPVFLPDLPQHLSPVAALIEALCLSEDGTSSTSLIEQFLACDLSLDVIRLTGIEILQKDVRHRWAEFLSLWAEISQSKSLSHTEHSFPSFCLIVPADALLSTLPLSNVFLELRWWWGFPSILETQLLCRNNDTEHRGARAQWREYVLPSIASGDVTLVDYLWDNLDIDMEGLNRHLLCFASERGWDRENLCFWGIENSRNTLPYVTRQQTTSPPVSMRHLWSKGVLTWTMEYGYELHSAALAVIDDYDGINHRLWRGQSRLLLPLVDHLRLRICHHLNEKYGKDWPVRWCLPPEDEEEAVRNNPLACQWGHMVTLFRRGHLRAVKNRWYDIALLSHQIRNKIAHYSPVSFQEYATLFQILDQATEHNVV